MDIKDIVGKKFTLSNYMFGMHRITFTKTVFSIEKLAYNTYSLRFYHDGEGVLTLSVSKFVTIDDSRIEIHTCGFFNIEPDVYTILKCDNNLLMIMPEKWYVPSCKMVEIDNISN